MKTKGLSLFVYLLDKIGFDERGLKLFIFETTDYTHHENCTTRLPFYNLDKLEIEKACRLHWGYLVTICFYLFVIHVIIFLLSLCMKNKYKDEEDGEARRNTSFDILLIFEVYLNSNKGNSRNHNFCMWNIRWLLPRLVVYINEHIRASQLEKSGFRDELTN